MCQSIINHLNILEQAKKELSSQMLEREIGNLKFKIDTKFDSFVYSFDANHRNMNFKGMGISCRAVVIFSRCMEAYLAPEQIRIATDLKEKNEQAKKSIPVVIDKFVESAFQEDFKLYQIFYSLRSASTSFNPELPALKKIYKTSQKDLTEKINEAFNLCDDMISQNNDPRMEE
eukprot:401031-Ditylum_brightwellii.AAC.1